MNFLKLTRELEKIDNKRYRAVSEVNDTLKNSEKTAQAASNATMRVSNSDFTRKPITFENDVKPYQNYGTRLGKTVIDGAGNNIVGGLLNTIETKSNEASFNIQKRVENARKADEKLKSGNISRQDFMEIMKNPNNFATPYEKFAYNLGVRGVSEEEMQKNSLGRMHLDKGAKATAEATEGTSGITKGSLELANMGATLFGETAISTMTGMPVIGTIGLVSGGSAAYDAAKQGADVNKQALYGTAMGLSNAAIESLGGIGGTQVASKIGGKLGAKLLPKAVKKAFDTTAGKIAKNALEEGAEEALQYEVDRRIGNKILDTNTAYDSKQQAVNAMYGSIMGGVFGGARAVGDIHSGAKAEKQAVKQYVSDEMTRGKAITETFEPQKRAMPKEIAEKLDLSEDLISTKENKDINQLLSNRLKLPDAMADSVLVSNNLSRNSQNINEQFNDKDVRTQQSTVSLPNDAADAVPRLYFQDAGNGASKERISPNAENIKKYQSKIAQFESLRGSEGFTDAQIDESINVYKKAIEELQPQQPKQSTETVRELKPGQKVWADDFENYGVIEEAFPDFNLYNVRFHNSQTGATKIVEMSGENLQGISESLKPPEGASPFEADKVQQENLQRRMNEEKPPMQGADADVQSDGRNVSSKAQEYQARHEVAASRDISNLLGISNTNRTGEILPVVREISQGMRDGTMSDARASELFEQAYDLGRVISDEFYQQYKPVKDYLRTTKLHVDDATFNDITDYNDFRRRNMGTLQLNRTDGIPIDVLYAELSEQYPELFPDDLIATGDQLRQFSEVSKTIKTQESTLDDYYGEHASIQKQSAKQQFDQILNNLRHEMNIVNAYENDRADRLARDEDLKAQDLDVSISVEAVKNSKGFKRRMENAVDKNLLTEHDRKIVDAMLSDAEIANNLDGLKPNNRAGVQAIFEAKKAYRESLIPIRQYNAIRKQLLADKVAADIEGSENWHDKAFGKLYSRETMERNNRDVISDKAQAEKINKEYILPVHANEAKATKYKNELRKKIHDLNLTDTESVMVQLKGEPDTDIKTISEFYENNKNHIDLKKVENAVGVFRKIYKEVIDAANEALVRNGYETVDFRKDYFPHFTEEAADTLLSKMARIAGINLNADNLRTDISGITQTFKPGKKWVGNFLQRTGTDTVYDAVAGFDRYIDNVADVIFHTDDIQRLRALEDGIRYKHSDKGVQEAIDAIRNDNSLDELAKRDAIERIYDNSKIGLGNYVTELRRYTNILAGKKSDADRSWEQDWGRKIYELGRKTESRVAANMVGLNPGSWLTNFIPITQATGEIPIKYLSKGMQDTVKNYIKNDGFSNSSDFITNRRGSERLVKTKLQKASDIAGAPMGAIDDFTSNTIVRARTSQNLDNGMSFDDALSEADRFTAGLMADRSKGAMPTRFYAQNPVSKAFNMFQLEVNNQLSYMGKDLKDRMGEQGKLAIAGALTKIFFSGFLYNELYQMLNGRRPSFDPIGAIRDAFGIGKEEDEKPKDARDVMESLGKSVLEQTPFVGGFFNGGRLPISSAVPDGTQLIKLFDNEVSGEKKSDILRKEGLKPLLYLGMPFGGGQLKKTIEGLATVNAGGSYSVNNEGRQQLDFPLYGKSPIDYTQNMIFGKYSSENAQKYVDSGFKKLSADDTASYQEAIKQGIDAEFFYNKIAEMKKIESVKDSDGKIIESSSDIKRKKIMEMDLTPKQKEFCDKAFTVTDKPADYSSEGAFKASTQLSDKKLEKARSGYQKHDISYEVFLEANDKLSDIKSDKYINGKSMNNASLKKKAYIDEIPDLNDKQRKYLYEVFEVSETVQNTPTLNIIYQKKAKPKMEILWGK